MPGHPCGSNSFAFFFRAFRVPRLLSLFGVPFSQVSSSASSVVSFFLLLPSCPGLARPLCAPVFPNTFVVHSLSILLSCFSCSEAAQPFRGSILPTIFIRAFRSSFFLILPHSCLFVWISGSPSFSFFLLPLVNFAVQFLLRNFICL